MFQFCFPKNPLAISSHCYELFARFPSSFSIEHLAYSFRDDARRGGERSREGWEFKARDADDTDDNIRPWVSNDTKAALTYTVYDFCYCLLND